MKPLSPSRTVCALAVVATLLVGVIGARFFFGADATAARSRVEAEVRADFDTLAASLQRMARPVASPALLAAAAGGDTAAARQLFTAADAALGQQPAEGRAVTAYAADGNPVAWAVVPLTCRQIGCRGRKRGSSSRVRSGCGSSISPRS